MNIFEFETISTIVNWLSIFQALIFASLLYLLFYLDSVNVNTKKLAFWVSLFAIVIPELANHYKDEAYKKDKENVYKVIDTFNNTFGSHGQLITTFDKDIKSIKKDLVEIETKLNTSSTEVKEKTN